MHPPFLSFRFFCEKYAKAIEKKDCLWYNNQSGSMPFGCRLQINEQRGIAGSVVPSFFKENPDGRAG